MSIGDRIRTARKAAGLSQEELARRAGMSLKGMGDIERGDIADPHYSSLSKIAGGLGIPVGELLEEPVPLADAPGEGTGPATTEETAEERNEADARRLRALARPVLEHMDQTVKRWEALVREDEVDRGLYWESRASVSGFLAQLEGVLQLLKEEGIDWTNCRNRKILRAHEELQNAFAILEHAYLAILAKYEEILPEDTERREQLRRDKEAKEREIRKSSFRVAS